MKAEPTRLITLNQAWPNRGSRASCGSCVNTVFIRLKVVKFSNCSPWKPACGLHARCDLRIARKRAWWLAQARTHWCGKCNTVRNAAIGLLTGWPPLLETKLASNPQLLIVCYQETRCSPKTRILWITFSDFWGIFANRATPTVSIAPHRSAFGSNGASCLPASALAWNFVPSSSSLVYVCYIAS